MGTSASDTLRDFILPMELSKNRSPRNRQFSTYSPDGRDSPRCILHPRLPGGLHLSQILLNVFNQEFAAEFEMAIAVVPLEGVDLARLAVPFDYQAIRVLSALRRMPGMGWQQVHLALAHNDLGAVA